MASPNPNVLTYLIRSLRLSDEFKKMAEVNQFETIQQILDSKLDKLHELPSSGYRMLKELDDFLKANGLGGLKD